MMNNRALVVIDIQNDITKHYRDIIDNMFPPSLHGATGRELCIHNKTTD